MYTICKADTAMAPQLEGFPSDSQTDGHLWQGSVWAELGLKSHEGTHMGESTVMHRLGRESAHNNVLQALVPHKMDGMGRTHG